MAQNINLIWSQDKPSWKWNTTELIVLLKSPRGTWGGSWSMGDWLCTMSHKKEVARGDSVWKAAIWSFSIIGVSLLLSHFLGVWVPIYFCCRTEWNREYCRITIRVEKVQDISQEQERSLEFRWLFKEFYYESFGGILNYSWRCNHYFGLKDLILSHWRFGY